MAQMVPIGQHRTIHINCVDLIKVICKQLLVNVFPAKIPLVFMMKGIQTLMKYRDQLKVVEFARLIVMGIPYTFGQTTF